MAEHGKKLGANKNDHEQFLKHERVRLWVDEIQFLSPKKKPMNKKEDKENKRKKENKQTKRKKENKQTKRKKENKQTKASLQHNNNMMRTWVEPIRPKHPLKNFVPREKVLAAFGLTVSSFVPMHNLPFMKTPGLL